MPEFGINFQMGSHIYSFTWTNRQRDKELLELASQKASLTNDDGPATATAAAAIFNF